MSFHFSTDVRVRLPETDAFGIVFHGYFFTYFDVARMDYLRNLGVIDNVRPGGTVSSKDADASEHVATLRKAGWPSPIVHAHADFRSPARFDDVLVIHARVVELGHASFTFEFRVMHKMENRLVAEGRTVQVVIDEKTWKPIPVPAEFRSRVRAFEGKDVVERA